MLHIVITKESFNKKLKCHTHVILHFFQGALYPFPDEFGIHFKLVDSEDYVMMEVCFVPSHFHSQHEMRALNDISYVIWVGVCEGAVE